MNTNRWECYSRTKTDLNIRWADSSNNKNKSLNTGNKTNSSWGSFSSNSNNNRPAGSIEINGSQTSTAVAVKTQRQRSKDSGFGDEESPKDNYQQWKKLATIAKGTLYNHMVLLDLIIIRTSRKRNWWCIRHAGRSKKTNSDSSCSKSKTTCPQSEFK